MLVIEMTLAAPVLACALSGAEPSVSAGDLVAAMERSASLAARGADAVAELEKGLLAGGAARLAAAYGLAVVGDPRGIKELGRMLAEGPREIRTAAARALGALGSEGSAMLARALSEEDDDEARVGIADSLLAGDPARRDATRALGLIARKGGHAGRLAAVVLAERGRLDLVRNEIDELAKLPTELGRRARLALKSSVGPRMLEEVMDLVRRHYVDPSRAEAAKMLTAAAKGLAQSLDDYSEYLDAEDVAETNDLLMKGRYGGIGAWVGMRNGVFTIISPIFGGPAYKVGIRSQDQVLEVDEVRTSDVPFHKVVTMLKGTPQTEVRVKVWRRGWAEPRVIVITREEIKIESVRWGMLDGGVGYIHLVRFSATSVADLKKALKELSADDLRGLVFDLRYDGGGLLRTAVDVADIFLSGERLVVSSKGRSDGDSTRRMWTKSADDFLLPMVVMTNGGSASASEIVAGALQDWRRAPIVGEKTFGKGSVQTLFGLSSTGGSTKLKLTVARYYLPRDDCIDGVGVRPDVRLKAREMPGWKQEELEKIRRTGKLEDYAADLAKGDPALAKEMAESAEPEFPGFDELYSEFKTTFDMRDAVRREVRRIVRRRVAEREGKEFVVDLAEDVQLRKVHEAFVKVLGEGGENVGYDELLAALRPLDEGEK